MPKISSIIVIQRPTEAKVKEKVSAESQDPSLVSAMAKLAVLEHTVESRRRVSGVVNGKENGRGHNDDSIIALLLAVSTQVW
jgi:hypothetical protein